jgi:hypothetical protein
MISLEELRHVAADRATERTLPLEENQRIFRDEIVPAELGHTTGQAEPTVLFLIGQQGAGKTWLSRQLARYRLDKQGDYINVDSDRYKQYHPEYLRLLAESHRADDSATGLGARRWSAANHTRADVNRWERQVDAFARGDRPGKLGPRNDIPHALLQCSGKDPHSIVRRLRQFRTTHHRIEVVFLGVPKALSWQGILYRYQVAVDERGWGRLTGPVSREPSYNGVFELADLIQDLGLADRVAVHRQGAEQPTWANDRARDGSPSSGVVRAVIERERERPLTEQEAARFAARQKYLAERMDSEFHQELREITTLAQPLLRPATRLGRVAADTGSLPRQGDAALRS